MKKVIIIVISIVVCLNLLILFMVSNNNRYIKSIKKDIIDNTEINNIKDVSEYNGHYIVSNNKYLYLIDSSYEIVDELEMSKVHENKNDYSIVYVEDKFMYLNDKYQDGKLTYEYYDISSYELVDRVLVGG